MPCQDSCRRCCSGAAGCSRGGSAAPTGDPLLRQHPVRQLPQLLRHGRHRRRRVLNRIAALLVSADNSTRGMQRDFLGFAKSVKHRNSSPPGAWSPCHPGGCASCNASHPNARRSDQKTKTEEHHLPLPQDVKAFLVWAMGECHAPTDLQASPSTCDQVPRGL